MPQPIRLLIAIEYFRDSRPWRSHRVNHPSWQAVEDAIRRMDNFCFPIVQLGTTEYEDDEDLFNVVGGAGQYALFHHMGDWQFTDPSGSDERVHLWESDQGYDCTGRNVLRDVERVLRVASEFYRTGSYESLGSVA